MLILPHLAFGNSRGALTCNMSWLAGIHASGAPSASACHHVQYESICIGKGHTRPLLESAKMYKTTIQQQNNLEKSNKTTQKAESAPKMGGTGLRIILAVVAVCVRTLDYYEKAETCVGYLAA